MQLESPSFAFGTDVARGSVCPSFAFGTDVARGSVSFGPNQGIVRKPNIAITRGKITQWHTRFDCPSFAFGTDGARGSVCPSFTFGTYVARRSVSFGPNQEMVR